jgi:ketosteroid isomerase-like protein
MGELGLLAQGFSDAALSGNAHLDRMFCTAMSGKDIEGAMRCFLDSPALVVVLYGKVVSGPGELRQSLAEMFSSMKTLRMEINEVNHWALGETVFAVGTATYFFEDQNGRKSTLKERWTDARQRASGRWVYVLSHATRIR